jgi:hypothetical protein
LRGGGTVASRCLGRKKGQIHALPTSQALPFRDAQVIGTTNDERVEEGFYTHQRRTLTTSLPALVSMDSGDWLCFKMFFSRSEFWFVLVFAMTMISRREFGMSPVTKTTREQNLTFSELGFLLADTQYIRTNIVWLETV